MMRRSAVGAALCFAGAVALHAQDRWLLVPSVDRPELLYVRSPAMMKRMALDYDGLLADVYWIRTLQHFGRERLSPPGHVRTYALLYPMLDLTTTLDPRFSIAYRFGAIFLGEPYPGGPGRADLAVALLRKGLEASPAKWQYMQDLGFVYFWHLQDYRTAAAWFRRASEVSGAPNWLRPLAAVTLAQGGHRGASRALWLQIAQSEEPWLRSSAMLRLAQLDAMDTIDALGARVHAFQRQHPGEPVSWAALVRDGLLPAVPADSTGVPFVVDPASGRVTISRDSKLFPLPGQKPGERP